MRESDIYERKKGIQEREREKKGETGSDSIKINQVTCVYTNRVSIHKFLLTISFEKGEESETLLPNAFLLA